MSSCFQTISSHLKSKHKKKLWHLTNTIPKDDPEATLEYYKSNLLDRTDEKSLKILTRLSGCSDLPAVEARYHHDCRSEFQLSMITSPEKNPRGRPNGKIQKENFDRLCDWLENEGELYTVQELFTKMKELSDTPEVSDNFYSTRNYLKTKLSEKYNEGILFSNVSGKQDVACLVDIASAKLNEAWYANRASNKKEEASRIITMAVKLIQEDIRKKKFDIDVFPSNEDIQSAEKNHEYLPDHLRFKSFMCVLVSI